MLSWSLRLKGILKSTIFRLYEEGDFMSIYTEAEHAIALSDTLYWIEHPPMTPEERYAYGLYQYRLKDYNEAFHWFSMAASDGVEDAWFDMGQCLLQDRIDTDTMAADPHTHINCFSQEHLTYTAACFKNAWKFYNCEDKKNFLAAEYMISKSTLPEGIVKNTEALYRRAWMLRYGLGTEPDLEKAYDLFQGVIILHKDLTPSDFDICCDFSCEGSGISADSAGTSPINNCKLSVGAACFELAKYFLGGLSPAHKSISEGRKLLKKAYDFHCEEALFQDFDNFGSNYDTYEYQDDIRELYSFRIGQYGRVCDIHPSKKAYLRLIGMYENGYPGDNNERRLDFAKKAAPIYKKMEALK